MIEKISQKATLVPNYEGGNILKHLISQNFFNIWIYAPRQQKKKKKIDALVTRHPF